MIEIKNLYKKIGEQWITRGLNLTIPSHEMTIIIGKSGEGKSVLLKQLIGLIKPTSGSIIIDGADITQLTQKELHAMYQKIGYVFQFGALLDSLNVFENVGLPLLEEGQARDAILETVIEKIRLVQLDTDILYKYPHQLSGGMRKRVALARTLIMNPSIILYDEPTTGLDPITTRAIHELMASLQKQLRVTSVVISHDLDIFNYADNVALLYEGTVKFFGHAVTIWECDNPYVHQFIRGITNGPMHTDIAFSQKIGITIV